MVAEVTPAPQKWSATRSLAVALALSAFSLVEWRIAAATDVDARTMLLGLIGLAIGATLFSTNFGFSSAFRQAYAQRDFNAFGAHAVMFALAQSAMVPLLALGSVFGQELTGFATPIGVSFVAGAALFGVGMQLSGGCASGTLFLLGGGNLKFLVALAAFIVGSTIGAAHIGFWRQLPQVEPITVFSVDSWPVALGLSLIALIAAALIIRKLSPSAVPLRLVVGAILLASLNVLTLIVAGRPWSETYGFALWGSKLSRALGWHPESWVYWAESRALDASIFADTTSIMDLSIVLGALLAGMLGSGFRLQIGGSVRSWVAAVIGGLMMGYGARLSGGCNIGAYFSAIASGDFSGWVWAGVALSTTGLGIQLRNRLGRP